MIISPPPRHIPMTFTYYCCTPMKTGSKIPPSSAHSTVWKPEEPNATHSAFPLGEKWIALAIHSLFLHALDHTSKYGSKSDVKEKNSLLVSRMRKNSLFPCFRSLVSWKMTGISNHVREGLGNGLPTAIHFSPRGKSRMLRIRFLLRSHCMKVSVLTPSKKSRPLDVMLQPYGFINTLVSNLSLSI